MKSNNEINFFFVIKLASKTKMIRLFLTIILISPSLFYSEIKTNQTPSTFNVLKYGAVGDGKTLDSKSIQTAIDEAAKIGKGSVVLIPTGYKFLIGTLQLKSNITFHLEGDAELIVSTNQKDYIGRAAIVANDAENLTISGTGSINGQAMEFMSHYDEENEWWIPKSFRPRLFILTKCNNLKILNFTINKAPSWSLHMLGCEDVLIDGIKIFNYLDVPNCDGIDPDHCRNVVIKNCYISCGDDAIVIKTTRQKENYGPSANIHVYNCTLETQDSGLKIGTETTEDIFNIVFEKCEIITSCRGLNIQLRDEGNVYDITFKDIIFTSRYYSAPWWGRGEAISLTAIPRTKETNIGTISDIKLINITGKAENSIRINGTKESRISNVTMDNVNVTFNRWTNYPGGLFDNRPTKAYPDIEQNNNPGIYIRFSDHVVLNNCSINWGDNVPDYFTNAIYAHDVTSLQIEGFEGQAAHPDHDKAIFILEDNNN